MKNSKKKDYYTNNKNCIICFANLDDKNTRLADIKQARYICINCSKARDKQKYIDKKELIREQQRIYDLNNKIKIINAYGAKCNCCNENTIEFLNIYCLESEKISGGKLYRLLIKNNFPQNNYELLCYNCKSSRNIFGYCPHKRQDISIKI